MDWTNIMNKGELKMDNHSNITGLLNYLSKFFKTWLSRNFIIGISSVLLSSAFIYIVGYLFLWGYYFGGSINVEGSSLFLSTIQFVPFNKIALTSVGLFYFLVLVILAFFVLSIKEGFSFVKFVMLVFIVVLINTTLSLFFYGDSTPSLVVKMLYFWIGPLLIVCVLNYFYTWINFPSDSVKALVYFIIVLFNLVIIDGYWFSNRLIGVYIPEESIGFFYFVFPLLVHLKTISNKTIKNILKFILYSIGTIPIVPILVSSIIDNVYISLSVSVLIIASIVIVGEKNLHKKFFTLIKERKNYNDNKLNKTSNFQLFGSAKSFISWMFIVASLLAFLVVFSNLLVKGGEYFQIIINNSNQYQQISYVWNDKVETIKGVLVAREENTYYVSTKNQELLIIKAQYILAE